MSDCFNVLNFLSLSCEAVFCKYCCVCSLALVLASRICCYFACCFYCFNNIMCFIILAYDRCCNFAVILIPLIYRSTVLMFKCVNVYKILSLSFKQLVLEYCCVGCCSFFLAGCGSFYCCCYSCCFCFNVAWIVLTSYCCCYSLVIF